MRRVDARAVTAWIFLSALAGCGRCSSPKVELDSGPAPFAITTLPPPVAWTFAPVRKDVDVVAPESCTTRAPLVRALVALTTRFVAEPRTLGALVVADGADDPPRLTGAAALGLDAAGVTHDPKPTPWLGPSSPPRLGRTAAGLWIGAFARPGEGGASRVGLFRDGAVDLQGEGDAFEAADLGCAGERCALLKTPAPPLGGSLRRLAKGALATWVAPLGCNRPRRVLYAVVLDADGAPVGAPTAVSDASSYAVAASGANVDLWVHHETRVTWMRLQCAAP